MPSSKPRLVDLFVFDKSKRRKSLVTQDGTTIARDKVMPASCYGESFPIAGTSIAMDARPRADDRVVTFDGAMPSRNV